VVNTPKYGSPMKGEPASCEGERMLMMERSPNAARLSRQEPRIVQMCVQCIANLACDEVDEVRSLSSASLCSALLCSALLCRNE
jgi:hypothetical protein